MSQKGYNSERVPIYRDESKGFAPVSIILLVAALGLGGYFVYANYSNLSQDSSKVIQNQTPTQRIIQSTPTPEPVITRINSFDYNSLSISYPDDWLLIDMSTNENFPLKERLYPLYSSDKVIALNKNGVYLIITIEEAKEGVGAGGIFIDDQDYNEFISDKDEVLIGNSIFYLNRNHYDIPSLLESHGGPYGWSALTEYIPDKQIKSGKVFKGNENVIKRNGYAYNFIVVSNQGGNTNPKLQKEIISILKTINW